MCSTSPSHKRPQAGILDHHLTGRGSFGAGPFSHRLGAFDRRGTQRSGDDAHLQWGQTGHFLHRDVRLRTAHGNHRGRDARMRLEVLGQRPGRPLLQPQRGVFDDTRYTQAKRPGLQAEYEKGAAGAVGVLTGCDDLHYVGVLSFDEIFSPVQMAPILNWVGCWASYVGVSRAATRGSVALIREGLEKGYMQADSTLDHNFEAYWTPRLLDRLFLHTFRQVNGKTARQRNRDEMLSRLQAYAYQPLSGSSAHGRSSRGAGNS
jgi:hypothetical protein